jgi:hypothetical protein
MRGSPNDAKGQKYCVPSEAFQALAGEVVRRIEPHTKADPLVLLASFEPKGAAVRDTSVPWNQFIFDPQAPIPLEQPIYQGLLAKGDLAIWLGREKHRKSNVLLQFAICAALGRSFLHFEFCPTEPLKVVVLDYESKSQTIKQRYDAILSAMNVDEQERETLLANLHIVEMRKAFRKGVKLPRFPVTTEKGTHQEEAWRSFVREADADLYVIDPMRCMHATSETGRRLLTSKEVAARLVVSEAWVKDHASGRRSPKLPCIHLGGLLRFRASDIEEFLSSNERNGL